MFIREKSLISILTKNKVLIEMILKGLLKYMGVDNLCNHACEILVKIFKPSSFGRKTSGLEKGILIDLTKEFFENNPTVFQEFMDNYNKMINKIMTEYTVALSDASKVMNNLRNQDPYLEEHQTSSIRKVIFSYTILCELMTIMEFLLMAYPKQFFDINNLNCSRLINFLKNLSSRMLENSYMEKLSKVFVKYKKANPTELMTQIVFPVIGLFLNIYNNSHLNNYNDFIFKLISATDFDVEPLYNIIEIVKKDDNILCDISKYREVLDNLSNLKTNKAEKKMSEEEWEEKTKNEKICIICYVNEVDKELVPCKHGKFFYIL
jgi:hypothetical protein